MQTVQLATSKREKTGKSENHKLKRLALIPAVIYGGEKNYNISISYNDFNKFYMKFKHSNVFYELTLEGKKVQTLIKEVVVHPVDSSIMHIDFYELKEDRKLKTKVAVELTGTPLGIKEGGILQFFVRELSIESLPKDIPDSIVVDVSGLNINDLITVKDVKLAGNIRILDDLEEVIVKVGLPQKEEEVAVVATEAVPGAEGAAAPVAGAPGVAGAPAAAGAPAVAGAKGVASPTAGAKGGAAPVAGAKGAAGGDKKPSK